MGREVSLRDMVVLLTSMAINSDSRINGKGGVVK